MGLLNRTNKPLRITGHAVAGPVQSSLRPVHVEKLAPCMADCACGTDVRGWVSILALRQKTGQSEDEALHEAWNAIVRTNPFPSSMGRICPHPCNLHCSRGQKDVAMAVPALERFLGDRALERGWTLPLLAEPGTLPGSAGVVGAGPAGLSFAWQLARRGMAVTVYEAMPEPGGMLRYGVPPFRLPRAVLEGEIARLREAGVAIRRGVRIGRDLVLSDLEKLHSTTFLAIGAWVGRRLCCPGEEGTDVETALAFLLDGPGGAQSQSGFRTVVVGGGGTGLDAARLARRRGAGVVVVERLSGPSELPLSAEEIARAQEEGCAIRYGFEVTGIRRIRGKVVAVLGRTADGQACELPADHVVVAVAQNPDWEGLDGIREAMEGLQTSDPGRVAETLFLGGDAREVAIAGAAVRAGRLAAEAALIGGGLSAGTVTLLPPIAPEKIRHELYEARDALAPAHVEPAVRLAQPEAEEGLPITEEQFFAEVGRCMSCGRCNLCERCWMYCTPGCFQRKPISRAGQTWSINLATCDGCGKCADECPCRVLEMK